MQIYNFGAGPAKVPDDVLQRAYAEFFNWNGTGMNVMEIGHRSGDFFAFAEKTEHDLRELLSIPANYKVLFLSGGATSQFAMVPINLLREKHKADYLVTGIWSEKAANEAKRFCQVNVVASDKERGYIGIPDRNTWQLSTDAAYLYYTSNETISGVEFHEVPNVGHTVLVSDMSSNLLTRPIDIDRYGCIFACAQKNFGQAGVTLVIVREDLIGAPISGMPTMFDYKAHADHNSMLNTPPTYAWYIAGLTIAWLKEQGGLKAMAERNQHKAELLYQAIDMSDFYINRVDKSARSYLSVPFILNDSNLDATFLSEAKQHGLLNLKGHRAVGGMRACIYNAMPLAGVNALIDFMHGFAKRYH